MLSISQPGLLIWGCSIYFTKCALSFFKSLSNTASTHFPKKFSLLSLVCSAKNSWNQDTVTHWCITVQYVWSCQLITPYLLSNWLTSFYFCFPYFGGNLARFIGWMFFCYTWVFFSFSFFHSKCLLRASPPSSWLVYEPGSDNTRPANSLLQIPPIPLHSRLILGLIIPQLWHSSAVQESSAGSALIGLRVSSLCFDHMDQGPLGEIFLHALFHWGLSRSPQSPPLPQSISVNTMEIHSLAHLLFLWWNQPLFLEDLSLPLSFSLTHSCFKH